MNDFLKRHGAGKRKGEPMRKLIDAEKLIEKLSTGLDNPEEFPVISLGTILRMIDNEPEVVAQPYTAEEIDKMQELESVQLEKVYELGRKSAQKICHTCFNRPDCPWSNIDNGYCHKWSEE